MINVVIIEDELAPREHLTNLLNEHFPDFKIIGHAESVSEGVLLIENFKPDIVFLDIQIKEGCGFDILDHFGSNITFETIFCTAYMDYKEKAMDYFAFYYLNKPLELEQLKRVLDRYLLKQSSFDIQKYLAFKKQVVEKENAITIYTINGYESVEIANIIYCEAEGSYTCFYMNDGKKHIASNNLKKVENILGDFEFCRIHRSILINLKHVKAYDLDGSIKMTRGHVVRTSTRSKKNILKLLKIMSNNR